MDSLIITAAYILLAITIGALAMFIIGTFAWALVATLKPQPAPLDEDEN